MVGGDIEGGGITDGYVCAVSTFYLYVRVELLSYSLFHGESSVQELSRYGIHDGFLLPCLSTEMTETSYVRRSPLDMTTDRKSSCILTATSVTDSGTRAVAEVDEDG